jgi:hypothetical protein
VVQVSSLSKGDDSLLVLNLFIRVDDDSNDEVDHQNVQQVGDQVPKYPEKEDVYPFVERNYFFELTVGVERFLAEDTFVVIWNVQVFQ